MSKRVRPKQSGAVGGGYPKAPGQISWNGLYATYRWQAKKMGRVFEISLEDFIRLGSMPCFYCDLLPQRHNYYDTQKKNRSKTSEETRSRATIYKTGLDRIDSSRGYELDNLIPCCRQCNWAKSDLTTKEFYEWISRLTKKIV